MIFHKIFDKKLLTNNVNTVIIVVCVRMISTAVTAILYNIFEIKSIGRT